MRKISRTSLLAAFFVSQLFVNTSHAALIEQAKFDKVLIEPESDHLEEGEEWVAFDSSGKKKAIVVIVKLRKDGKAVGTLKKGRASVGFVLKKPFGGLANDPYSSEADKLFGFREQKKKKPSRFRFGAMGGFTMDTMDIKIGNVSFTTKGSGFLVGAVADLGISPRLAARGILAYETLSASGTAPSAVCDNSTSTKCSTQINYLSLDTWSKFRIASTFWSGIGFGFRVPLSVSSSALKKDTVVMTTVFLGGLGYDLKVGKGAIPLQIDYGLLMPPGDVTTSILAFRAGYMF